MDWKLLYSSIYDKNQNTNPIIHIALTRSKKSQKLAKLYIYYYYYHLSYIIYKNMFIHVDRPTIIMEIF